MAQRVDTKVLGLAFAVVLLWVAFNAFRSSGNSELNAIDAPPDAEKANALAFAIQQQAALSGRGLVRAR